MKWYTEMSDKLEKRAEKLAKKYYNEHVKEYLEDIKNRVIDAYVVGVNTFDDYYWNEVQYLQPKIRTDLCSDFCFDLYHTKNKEYLDSNFSPVGLEEITEELSLKQLDLMITNLKQIKTKRLTGVKELE